MVSIKKSIFYFLPLVFLSASCTENKPPETDEEKFSYMIGYNMGKGMKSQGVDISQSLLSQGIKDGLDGKESILNADEVQKVRASLIKKMREKRQKEAQMQEENGKKFLEENKNKEGVKTTDSGLQYKVLKEGTGKVPKISDKVSVHYRGRLIDGKEFDSSHKRNKPSEFPVNRVIKGWTEALTMMKVGGKWEVYIPSELAYGKVGSPPNIPPNAVLIFDVELLEIVQAGKKK